MIYQNGDFYVRDAGKKGYEVYQNGHVAATRVASIGRSLGLARAIAECDKRAAVRSAP